MSPNPDEPLRIFWDNAINNFRDFDSGAIVSRLVGIEHLHSANIGGVERFRDDLGRLVPSLIDLIPLSLRTEFVQRVTESKQTSVDVYSVRAPAGSFYQTLTAYLRDDGTLGIVLSSFKGNQPINPDLERAKLIRNILDRAEEDGLEANYEEAASAALAVVHYITR